MGSCKDCKFKVNHIQEDNWDRETGIYCNEILKKIEVDHNNRFSLETSVNSIKVSETFGCTLFKNEYIIHICLYTEKVDDYFYSCSICGNKKPIGI